MFEKVECNDCANGAAMAWPELYQEYVLMAENIQDRAYYRLSCFCAPLYNRTPLKEHPLKTHPSKRAPSKNAPSKSAPSKNAPYKKQHPLIMIIMIFKEVKKSKELIM
jgi:hypothetical protein